jgi:hypothetical protein
MSKTRSGLTVLCAGAFSGVLLASALEVSCSSTDEITIRDSGASLYNNDGASGNDANLPPESDTGATVSEDSGADASASDANSNPSSDSGPDSAGDGGSRLCEPLAPKEGTNVLADPGFEGPEAGVGWIGVNGAPPTSFTVTTDHKHCGTRSGGVPALARNGEFYKGIGRELPSSAARYDVSLWVYQDGTVPITGAVQVICSVGAKNEYPSISYNFPIPAATWVHVTGTINNNVAGAKDNADLTTYSDAGAAACTNPKFFVGGVPTFPDGGNQPVPGLYVDDVFIMQR